MTGDLREIILSEGHAKKAQSMKFIGIKVNNFCE